MWNMDSGIEFRCPVAGCPETHWAGMKGYSRLSYLVDHLNLHPHQERISLPTEWLRRNKCNIEKETGRVRSIMWSQDVDESGHDIVNHGGTGIEGRPEWSEMSTWGTHNRSGYDLIIDKECWAEFQQGSG